MRRAYIKHIASYYPEDVVYNDPNGRLTSKIGIASYHVARPDICASDMAVEASEILFEKYKIDRTTIDGLILCTQSPDYIMPSTACILQDRLSLRNDIIAYDYTSGCTGYVEGLSMAKAFIETGMAENILLLTADTYTKVVHRGDMRTRPLFGDSAAATLLSTKHSAIEHLSHFKFGTNGKEFNKLIVYYGGARMRYADRTQAHFDVYDQFGNARNDAHVYMDGKAVMQFAQRVVPVTMDEILKSARLEIGDIDNFIFHQANKVMLETVQKACGIEGDDARFWNDVTDIGNTVQSTIPNAINRMQDRNIKLGKHALLMGFGVGLAWNGCIADLSDI